MKTTSLKNNIDILSGYPTSEQANSSSRIWLEYILKEQPEKRIDLSNPKDLKVFITYNGRNAGQTHIYNYKTYSHVHDIHINDDGRICINCENCREYDFDNVTLNDQYEHILRAVKSIVDKDNSKDYTERILRYILMSQPKRFIDLSDLKDKEQGPLIYYPGTAIRPSNDGKQSNEYGEYITSKAVCEVLSIYIDNDDTIRMDCKGVPKGFELERIRTAEDREAILYAVQYTLEKQPDWKPSLSYFNTISEAITHRINLMNTRARNMTADILSRIPEKQIAADAHIGYLNCETEDGTRIEAGIKAIRTTKDGTIELDCSRNDGNDICTFSENDHHVTVNWPQTMQMLINHLKHHPELVKDNMVILPEKDNTQTETPTKEPNQETTEEESPSAPQNEKDRVIQKIRSYIQKRGTTYYEDGYAPDFPAYNIICLTDTGVHYRHLVRDKNNELTDFMPLTELDENLLIKILNSLPE